MALKDWPCAGFPGTAVNPTTLLPEVVDEELCVSALAESTDPADEVFVLIARGQTTDAAEAAANARLANPTAVKLQILDADLLRATKHFERAEKALKNLLGQSSDASMDAWIHQQLGKVYFTSENFDAAAKSFSTALDQRVAAGADAADIYASTISLRRALDMAERQ